MRFQVPQFIEVEDKIFGPLTFKQFIYVAGSIGMAVILFIFLPTFIAIILGVPIVIFGVALAFYKVNDKPFINMVEAFMQYHMTNKLYIWKKQPPTLKSSGVPRAENSIEQVYVPKLSDSKLKELTWSLDIKENENPTTENDSKTNV